ncbi:MAG: FtsX-like permease family protein [Symploca sp. SIO3C6]|nr:FtsX-like permease family protein [Symploca sp. SIO3C6]
MKTPLAWLNLMHEKTRLMVASSGVAFAVLLVFMNLGFLESLSKAAALTYEQLNAEVFLVSPQTTDISGTDTFPRERLYQAAGIEGVDRVMPVYIGFQQWRNLETRQSRAMFIYAINPEDPVFLLPELQLSENQAALRRPDTVLMDQLSRPEYGPQKIGLTTELNRRKVKIGGLFSFGGGFSADGTLIMSDQNFRRFFDPRPLSEIDLGLIKLEVGADTSQVVEKLQAILPKDVLVLTREQIGTREGDYWISATSTGFYFGLGVVVSLVVGTVIVYQILYTDISNHLLQYATLKAMGYGSYYLFTIVIQEAVILAVLGYIPGFALSLGLYELTFRATSIPIGMDLERATFVLILSVVMCVVSGLVSVQKVIAADPAEVF